MLLSSKDVIKLADLGIAKFAETSIASTYAGSPAYMSPEQFRCQFDHGNYTNKSDIWFKRCFNCFNKHVWIG